jgi:hypothetical protein
MRRLLRRLPLGVCVAALAVMSGIGPAYADLVGFSSPSGNIGCMLDAGEVRCDIADRSWQPPPRPAWCEFDYGPGIRLRAGGQPEFVCASDSALGTPDRLDYGDSITQGPLRCESAPTGITCRDVNTGHGLSIARAGYQLF